MSGAFNIAAVGLDAQQKALDTIANNISNVNTAGFKRSQVRFAEILASRVDDRVLQAMVPSGSVGNGVRMESELLVGEQGALEPTGKAMDLAINGAGFIELVGPDGQSLLWRGGTLRIDEDGQLMSSTGHLLRAGISVPLDATKLEIGGDGVVRALTGDSAVPVEIGKIMLVRPENERALDPLSDGLYRLQQDVRVLEAKPGEDGAGMVVQGAIERSTVELTTEMVQLMMVQRAYAANAQIVQAADQLMGIANTLRR